MPVNPIQDTIELPLSSEKTVVNDTVRIVATITAQVQNDEPPEALPARVRSVMNKVIDLTKSDKGGWHFSNMNRTRDATGYERVTLTATARVPETENYNLVHRADQASHPGLVINSIEADASIPNYMIEEAVSDLRIKIAKKAKEEATKLSEALGREYRVQRINFVSSDGGGPKALAMRAMASNTTSYGSGTGDDGTLGNAQKVTVLSQVTLATLVELPDSYQGL